MTEYLSKNKFTVAFSLATHMHLFSLFQPEANIWYRISGLGSAVSSWASTAMDEYLESTKLGATKEEDM